MAYGLDLQGGGSRAEPLELTGVSSTGSFIFQAAAPIFHKQGLYTDRLLGESTPLPHENVGVLIRVRQKLMRKST